MPNEERRRFERVDLETLSAPLYYVQESREIDFSPINVSQQGLSIYTTVQLPAHSKLILKLDSANVELEVRWCRPVPEDAAFFRCGLEVLDKEIHLDLLIKKQLT
jgi:hypothetical protein